MYIDKKDTSYSISKNRFVIHIVWTAQKCTSCKPNALHYILILYSLYTNCVSYRQKDANYRQNATDHVIL